MMTVNEFWEYSNRPENADRNLDLLHGEVIEWERPYLKHGVVCARVGCILHEYAFQIGCGYAATNNVGVILPKPPSSVLGPDVTYFTYATADGNFSTGWDESLPLIAVEVHSLNHDERLERLKIEEYLRHDIANVWYIDYEAESLSAYRPNQIVTIFGSEDEFALQVLSDLDVMRQHRQIPDLRFRVGDLFLLPAELPRIPETS